MIMMAMTTMIEESSGGNKSAPFLTFGMCCFLDSATVLIVGDVRI